MRAASQVDTWCKCAGFDYEEMQWALAGRSPGERVSAQLSKQLHLGRGVQHFLKRCLQINSSQCSGINSPRRLSPAVWFFSAVTQQAHFCVLTRELPWEEVAGRFE